MLKYRRSGRRAAPATLDWAAMSYVTEPFRAYGDEHENVTRAFGRDGCRRNRRRAGTNEDHPVEAGFDVCIFPRRTPRMRQGARDVGRLGTPTDFLSRRFSDDAARRHRHRASPDRNEA